MESRKRGKPAKSSVSDPFTRLVELFKALPPDRQELLLQELEGMENTDGVHTGGDKSPEEIRS